MVASEKECEDLKAANAAASGAEEVLTGVAREAEGLLESGELEDPGGRRAGAPEGKALLAVGHTREVELQDDPGRTGSPCRGGSRTREPRSGGACNRDTRRECAGTVGTGEDRSTSCASVDVRHRGGRTGTWTLADAGAVLDGP